jgi:hypothetical protein
MSIVSNIKVVDKSGNTVINVDENGFRDGSTISRVYSPFEFLFDRIFATPLAAYMWRCFEGVWQVTNVGADCSVTGGASTTADVLVCAPAVAPGSGTSQLTAVIDIEETAPFQRTGTLIASPTLIHPGMLVARVYAGTVASVEGILTVQIRRIS